jgi:hypothetical protein
MAVQRRTLQRLMMQLGVVLVVCCTRHDGGGTSWLVTQRCCGKSISP